MRFQEIRGFRCARRHLGRGPHGSLTALLGPSGSGKSTLLRAIPGLEKQDSGEIFVFEEENTQVPPQKRGVGFVFQHYAAFKPMTVFENVAFGLKIRKRKKAEIRKRVHELLELVQLEAFADRYPAQLSGGQRQRMALARALAIEPQILLLDEPFGALDARVRQELRAWLRRLYEEIEVTTVLATHDQEEAMELDGRVVLMNHGRIEQVGEPQDLYENPANEFVMSFVGPANKFGDTFVRPHDIEIQTNPNGSTSEATVDHPVHLGFEVHVEMTLKDGSRLWAQITREGARRLGLDQDKTVHVRIDHTTVFDKPWEVRSPSPDKT